MSSSRSGTITTNFGRLATIVHDEAGSATLLPLSRTPHLAALGGLLRAPFALPAGIAPALSQPAREQEAAGAADHENEDAEGAEFHAQSTRTMLVGLKPRSAALPLRARLARALLSVRISSVSSRSLPPRPMPSIFTLRV